MQRAPQLSLKRLGHIPQTLRPRDTRPFTSACKPRAPTYQCISPLAKQRAEAALRRSKPQWQASRTVAYTNRDSTFLERCRKLQRTNPVLFPTSLFCIAIGFCMAIYTTYYYIYAIYPIDSTYPAPIANKLKRALHYTYQDVQPQKAWDYYIQAMALCNEHELNPFSAEVLGIRLQAVGMLDKTNNLQQAKQLLEKIRNDCLEFVEFCDAKIPEKPDLKPHRTRVLEKAVQASVKLGEYYSSEYMRDDAEAEKNLVKALELLLAETHRRERLKVTDEEEGKWMSPEEIGASLESLADLYEQKSKHNLAAPLYLRAVTLAQPPSCHTAVLMNNLAASLAQTSPERPPASSDTRSDPPTSRSALISNAREWTEKSLAICRSLQPPTRTEECDAACAVATHNLGEFAEMEGLVDEARKRYQEARGLAKAVGFSDGVQQANEALKRLSSEA